MQVLADSGFEIIANPHDKPAPREWVLTHLADPDVHGICVMHSQAEDKVDAEFLAACNPNLKVISTFSVGFDHIDVAGANAKGIKVGHTPGVLSDSVADICTMLVLMTMRRVEEGIQLIKSGGVRLKRQG
jgi:glyoxylate/hydroxypyruvate reductase